MSTNLKTTPASPTNNVGVVKLFKDIDPGRDGADPGGFIQVGDRLGSSQVSRSVELKQPAFRIDGVIFPPEEPEATFIP